MKITIEHEGQTCSVYNPEAVTIMEALELCERALFAAGFVFEGELKIEEDEDS